MGGGIPFHFFLCLSINHCRVPRMNVSVVVVVVVDVVVVAA